MEEDLKSRELARRRHDITGAVRTLRAALDALKEGDRFEGEMGTAKLNAVEKAVKVLEREAPSWLESLASP
jgi:isoaspartyl peptidase/L-asparaginase-like protein (Ntn-hydrolase superfamily)